MNTESKYILAKNGISHWKIIISKEASESETYAAEELQRFIKKISGAVLPIDDEESRETKWEIVVGNSNRLEKLNLNIDWQDLGPEGFIIRTVGDKLIIVGGKLRGTLYGVYSFLEEYLGCRWFSSKVSRIPERGRVEIPSIDEKQFPVLEYREPYYFDAFDGDWAARNKANGHFPRLKPHHGGKVRYAHFVHTFHSLVPVEEYFDTHPEYFSEVDGKRIKERTQLCLTNPDVFGIALERVRQWIKEEPDATIISVSQNDWYNPCQCKNCKVIDEKEAIAERFCISSIRSLR